MMVRQEDTMGVIPLPGTHYTKFKRIFTIFILAISFMQINSAIQIEAGTIIRSENLNLTINFTQAAYVDQIIIGDSFIYLENFSVSGSANQTLNLTQTNTVYSETEVLSLSSSSSSGSPGSSSGGGDGSSSVPFQSSSNSTNNGSTNNAQNSNNESSSKEPNQLYNNIKSTASEINYITILGIALTIAAIVALFISLSKKLENVNTKIANTIKKEKKKKISS